MDKVNKGGKSDFVLSDDGILRFGTRLCVPSNEDLRRELLEEAHCSRLVIHLGGTKMYKDLKHNYILLNLLLSVWYVNRLKLSTNNQHGSYNRLLFQNGNGSTLLWIFLLGYQGP